MRSTSLAERSSKADWGDNRFAILIRPTGAEKLEQVGHNVQGILRPHGQWPERIKQPFRRFAHNAWGGQWENVGQGKRPGIAKAGFLRHALAVNQSDLAPCLLQIMGDGHANDAGADNNHIMLGRVGHMRLVLGRDSATPSPPSQKPYGRV